MQQLEEKKVKHTAKKSNAKGIDEAFKDADVEDKLWLFWQRNKAWLATVATAALITVVIIQGIKVYQTHAIENMQVAYSQIENDQQLAEFGANYKSTQLGGLAFLQLADNEYMAGNYQDAAKNYKNAIASLDSSPLTSRAQLGEGISLIKSNNVKGGVAVLQSLANNTNMLQSIRAEAAYNLALLAMGNKDYTQVNQWVQKIEQLPYRGVWKAQAQNLKESIPLEK